MNQPKPQPDLALYQFFLGQSLPSFDQIVKIFTSMKIATNC